MSFYRFYLEKFRTKKMYHIGRIWGRCESHRGNFLWLKPTMCNNSIDEKLRRLKAIKKKSRPTTQLSYIEVLRYRNKPYWKTKQQTSSEPFLRKMPSSWEGKFPPPHTNKKYIYRGKPVGCRIQTPPKKTTAPTSSSNQLAERHMKRLSMASGKELK